MRRNPAAQALACRYGSVRYVGNPSPTPSLGLPLRGFGSRRGETEGFWVQEEGNRGFWVQESGNLLPPTWRLFLSPGPKTRRSLDLDPKPLPNLDPKTLGEGPNMQ